MIIIFDQSSPPSLKNLEQVISDSTAQQRKSQTHAANPVTSRSRGVDGPPSSAMALHRNKERARVRFKISKYHGRTEEQRTAKTKGTLNSARNEERNDRVTGNTNKKTTLALDLAEATCVACSKKENLVNKGVAGEQSYCVNCGTDCNKNKPNKITNKTRSINKIKSMEGSSPDKEVHQVDHETEITDT